MTLPPVCILAGGLGTRLGGRARDVPKPLLEVAGEPFLAHQLRLLAAHGAVRAVLCVGYLGERIEAVIGRERSGVTVDYAYDDPPGAGTLGAVAGALPMLGDRFLVLYGDTYLRIDYQGFAGAWAASGLPAAMSVLHNRDQLQPSNAVYRDGRVLRYDKHHRDAEMEWIDYGLGGLHAGDVESARSNAGAPIAGVVGAVEAAVTDAGALATPAGAVAGDLAGLYSTLAARGEMFGYEATERFYDIGTPQALSETEEFLRGTAGART